MKPVCVALIVIGFLSWPAAASAKGHAHHVGRHVVHHRAAQVRRAAPRGGMRRVPAHHSAGRHVSHHRRQHTSVYYGGNTFYGGSYYGGSSYGGRRYYGHHYRNYSRGYGGYGGRGYGYSRRWRNSRYANSNRNSTPLTSSQAPVQRLTASQLDPATGKITWPAVLQANEYTPQRTELDRLFADRAQNDISPKLTSNISFEVDQMKDTLQTHVHGMPASSYIAARKFLDSLAYEGKQPLKS
jgi:hypothetical protein